MSERRLDANLSPQTFALEQAKYVFLTITAIRLNTQCSLTKSIYRECINTNITLKVYQQCLKSQNAALKSNYDLLNIPSH